MHIVRSKFFTVLIVVKFFSTSIHGVGAVESYNPLTDIWHGAQRAQSIHAYLPINVTIGLDLKFFFSYITPAGKIQEKICMGKT